MKCKNILLSNNLIFVSIMTLFLNISNAASFDCTKASTFVEKTICTDNKLSAMDEELNTLYNEVQQNSQYAEQRKKSQLAWLKERNKCNTKFSNEYAKSKCILASYNGRIQDLKKMKESKQLAFELIDKISFRNYGGLHTTSNNKIIFTNYDSRTRDKYQIIEVNPTDFRLKVLTTTKGESTYITHNKTFIVYKRRGLAATEELIIKNRKSNKIIAKKRFSDRIIWGEIVGNDKVLIVQKTEIFILDLKSLTITKRHDLKMNYAKYNRYNSRVLSVAKWKNKVVILTPENLLVFDKNLREVKTIVLGGSNSNRRNLVISNNKAVVSFEKDIKIFDLDTEKELLYISKPGRFVSYTIINNLLIIAPQEAGNGVLDAQVYNLSTGKIQATVPLIAKSITYNKGLMLTYDYKYRGKSTFTLYKVDLNKLANNDTMKTRLKEAYKYAQEAYTQTEDIYVALGILDKAGIEKYLLDKNPVLEEEKMIFRQYGIWLSQTLDKFDKTKYVFDTAKINLNDKEIETALNLARMKECYLISECSANESDLKSIFGILEIPSSKISIKMSAIEKLYFIDDKIYVSMSNNGQIGTRIYSINTLQHTDDAYFNLENYQEYQDSVTNIIDLKDNVVLDIGARYSSKRDNFAVINKQNSSLVCTGFTLVNLEELAYENENICECLKDETHCKKKEQTVDRLDLIKQKVKTNGIEINTPEKVIDASKDYIITSTQWSEYKLKFYPFEKDNNSTSKKSMKHTKLYLLSKDNQIVYTDFDINSVMKDRVKFSFYDIATNKDETLFYAKRIINQRYPHSIIYKNLLIIGTGHDLFIYDVNKRKLVAYDMNFMQEPVLGHVDGNMIDKLYIYKDKLYVVTFNGENSRVVDLKSMLKLLKQK